MNSCENLFGADEKVVSEPLHNSDPLGPTAAAGTGDGPDAARSEPSGNAHALLAKFNSAATFVVVFIIAVVVGVYFLSPSTPQPDRTAQSKSVMRLANPINLLLWLAGSEHDLSDSQSIVTDALNKANHDDLLRDFRANGPVFDKPVDLSALNAQPLWKPQGDTRTSSPTNRSQHRWP